MNNSKNIIEELGRLVPVKNKHTIIEARAQHVISSAINLIESLRANYSTEEADDLTRRLVRSILQEDPNKFHRKLTQLRKEGPRDGTK